MLLRIAAGVALSLCWNLTTKWYELLQSLRTLGVPQLFLRTATLTYRYVFVVFETLGEMIEARTMRQIGAAGKSHVRTYAGNGSAILFAKSLVFTEEVHQAMRSRSFEQPRKSVISRKWSPLDFAFVAVGLLLLIVAFLMGVSHAI
jgi:energy-coupling factor transporter transmembrane protein EcfT